jgi:DNA ligase-1
MKVSAFSTYIQQIEHTSSRLEITRILGELFRELTPDEIEKSAYLLQGDLTPRYKPLNFGMAEKMIIKAVLLALQVDKDTFNKEYQKEGDIGVVTEKLKSERPSLTQNDIDVVTLFQRLFEIAGETGGGSQDKKIHMLAHLVNEVDPLTARYIVRIPAGTLRLGFSDMTILDALSWMVHQDKSLRKSLEQAYHVRPDLGYIGKILKEKGIKEVEKIQPTLFTPILMMRAERLSSGEEIIEKIGSCVVEPKFDGFRLQVHKKGKEVKLYTRGLEDATFMYPDIVEGVQKEVLVDEAIFEGEALGYDAASKSFLPFQETVQRKRKHGIEEKAKEVPLKLFTFELLYVDGESYIHRPLTERRAKLNKIISENNKIAESTIFLAAEELIDDPKKLELLFDDAITRGLEGIVAKRLDGTYQPGARGWNWIKFKRSYSSKIEDTIDCLVLGYDYGKGKRAGFGIGAFLVGVYEESEDRYVTVAKIGTGLTDDEWRELFTRAEKLKKDQKPVRYDVDRGMECDVWISPEIVVEIKADEITRSPIHTAGRMMKASKSGTAFDIDEAGYALRFPRLVRFRDDKTPEEITTLQELEDMFKAQSK